MATNRTREPSAGAIEFDLSGPAATAVGLGLALAVFAPLLFLSKLAGMQFLAVQLGFIGAVYFGFAIAEGEVKGLLIESLVSGAFLFAGAVALWADSPIILATGYTAHAGWDLVHHPRVVATPVRNWYPPFCVVYDLAFAAFVLVWLPLTGVG